jgi:hypothetical protein
MTVAEELAIAVRIPIASKTPIQFLKRSTAHWTTIDPRKIHRSSSLPRSTSKLPLTRQRHIGERASTVFLIFLSRTLKCFQAPKLYNHSYLRYGSGTNSSQQVSGKRNALCIAATSVFLTRRIACPTWSDEPPLRAEREKEVESLSRKSRFVLVVVSFLLMSWTGPSQAAPVDGDNEVLASGGFFHQQDADTGNFNVDLQYGYYLTPGWEIGLRQALNYNFIDDARDIWQASTTPFLHYNFRITDVLVPYLGLFGGIVWNDDDITGTIGPSAGLKLFVADQTFINLGYRYEWFFDSFRGASNNRSDGNHVGNIGVGFVWGGSGQRTGRP